MTFCPEWLTGSKALTTNNVLYLWFYLFFFNMLWVVVPLALMCHSWVDIRDHGIAPDFDSRAVRFPGKREGGFTLRSSGDEGYGMEAVTSPGRYNLRSHKDQ